MVRCRSFFCLGIVVLVEDDRGVKGRRVSPDRDDRAIRVVLDAIREPRRRPDLSRRGGVGVDDASLRRGGLERDPVKSGHNAKIVASTLQRPQEVRVLLAVCVDDLAGAQDNLTKISDDDVVSRFAGGHT